VAGYGFRERLLPLLTCEFMHGSWEHVLGNMVFLWAFGPVVEDRLGLFRYAVLYILGGMGGALLQIMADPNSTVPLVGASGSIAAVMGAHFLIAPWARTRVVFLPFWFFRRSIPTVIVMGLQFVVWLLSANAMTVEGENTGVAHWAHLGGFVTGMLLLYPLHWARLHQNSRYIEVD
jgi:membrane associated rhomboid family serine protease